MKLLAEKIKDRPTRECEICRLPMGAFDILCDWCFAHYVRKKDKQYECDGIVCPSCAYTNSPPRLTCPECGVEFSIACPQCECQVPLHSDRCPGCFLAYSRFSSFITEKAKDSRIRQIRKMRIGHVFNLALTAGMMLFIFFGVHTQIERYGPWEITGLILGEAFFVFLAYHLVKALRESFQNERGSKKW